MTYHKLENNPKKEDYVIHIICVYIIPTSTSIALLWYILYQGLQQSEL